MYRSLMVLGFDTDCDYNNKLIVLKSFDKKLLDLSHPILLNLNKKPTFHGCKIAK